MIFKNSRRYLSVVCLSTLIAISGPAAFASVFQYQQGKNVVISNVHVVDDDLYVYTSDFRMEGTINGDLTAFAYDATIQGQVSHAVNIFARSVSLTGRCAGPFRSFSEMVTLDGTVGGSAILLGRIVRFSKGAVIEKDLFARGAELTVDGTVNGNLDAKGDEITITGQIGGDVNVGCKRLYIKPPAVISGNLTYDCEENPQIDSSGVTIAGSVKKSTQKIAPESETQVIKAVAMRVSGLCAAFLFGLILLKLFPSYARASYQQLTNRFSSCLAAGVVVLGIIIGCVVVLVMSLITGIAGQVLFSTGQTGTAFGVVLTVFAILMLPISSFTALSGAILFYAGRVFIALFIGALLLRRKRESGHIPGNLELVLGLVILTLIFWIPIGGTLVYLFVAIAGAGAIVLGMRDCRKIAADSASAESPLRP